VGHGISFVALMAGQAGVRLMVLSIFEHGPGRVERIPAPIAKPRTRDPALASARLRASVLAINTAFCRLLNPAVTTASGWVSHQGPPCGAVDIASAFRDVQFEVSREGSPPAVSTQKPLA